MSPEYFSVLASSYCKCTLYELYMYLRTISAFSW